MDTLRIIFMGTPEFGLPALKELNEKYGVKAVVCQPDKPSNRGVINYSPIKKYALENNIKVYQPIKLSEDFVDILKENPNLIITCAYGQIIPDDLLRYPMYGCINIHASLLPKLRGGAPIHRAIMEGYNETGITIMKMSSKLDAGDIISQRKVIIEDTDNVGTLHDKLSIVGKELLMETIPSIINRTATYTKQDESMATYGWNIKKEDERIDYQETTREIVNKIRGLNPWPGAYSLLSGRIVKIWNARYGNNYYSDALNGQITNLYSDGIGVKTQNGEIIITELQLEGKRRMSANEFVNGVVNKEVLVGRIFE
ncbi:MAG: methionyl-tRNA formyltransferase [Bacilli bacterium]|jgi:methionyl-tRNA formyltransferase|nr:methionyl-tRNA formyltransferase [Bacilli bacterium]MBQ6282105.1 methionyl-tRNA formyltransferase [Bacilli bacterium]